MSLDPLAWRISIDAAERVQVGSWKGMKGWEHGGWTWRVEVERWRCGGEGQDRAAWPGAEAEVLRDGDPLWQQAWC